MVAAVVKLSSSSLVFAVAIRSFVVFDIVRQGQRPRAS